MSFLRVLGCATLVLPLLASAQDGISLPEEYLKTLALRYEATVGDHTNFPDGCENPYRETNDFMEFYEAAIVEYVLDRGLQAKGVAEMFGISEMRVQMKDVFPNMSEESPLDRLVTTQLCQYQKVYLQKAQTPGQLRPAPIHSGEKGLHDHLAKIAPKIYRDARRIVAESMTQRAKLRDRAKRLASRRNDIRRARRMGADLVEDLFAGARKKKDID